MTSRRTRILTCGLLALVAGGSALLYDHLGVERVRVGSAAAGTLVPVELALLVDTSGSVDDFEYALQKDGYARAFRSPELASMIESQGGIAIIYIEWSNATHQDVRLGWTYLESPADCQRYADQVAALERTITGETMLAPALQFAADQIESNDYVGFKRVIDVSGDGRGENYDYYLEHSDYSSYHGKPWDDVIADISGVVDQINGICITTREDVVEFYRDVLPQGPGAFMMQVDRFEDFENAIVTKLLREISRLPGLYD